MEKRRLILRIGLSIVISFHLICAITVPSQGTYIASRVAWFAEPYMNFFELSSRWSFFAPDPGPPPFYIEYELLDQDGNSIAKSTFPEKESPYFLRERQNRRIAAARFMVGADERTHEGMAPYLCRSRAGVHSVRLWRVQEAIPALRDVARGEKEITTGDEIGRRWVAHSYCEDLI